MTCLASEVGDLEQGLASGGIDLRVIRPLAGKIGVKVVGLFLCHGRLVGLPTPAPIESKARQGHVEADECVDAAFPDFGVAGSFARQLVEEGAGLVHCGDGLVDQPGSGAGDAEGCLG